MCILSILFASGCLASPLTYGGKKKAVPANDAIKLLKATPVRGLEALDLCPTCIKFTQESIQQLLNIILSMYLFSFICDHFLVYSIFYL